MNIKQNFKKAINWFENLFMINHACVCCDKEIPDGITYQICDDCMKIIDKLEEPVCEKCGDRIISGNKLCDFCKTGNYCFDENKSYCYYNDASSKIVKSFKYGARKYYAKHMAEMMTADMNYFADVDYLTFVPIAKSRFRERGFNQAEELAKEISKITGIKVLDLLFKLETGKHQAGLSRKDRLENLKETFSISGDYKEIVKGKVVLIIDDVFTTGATLDECSKTLKKLKPSKVKTLTFAKTKFEYKK